MAIKRAAGAALLCVCLLGGCRNAPVSDGQASAGSGQQAASASSEHSRTATSVSSPQESTVQTEPSQPLREFVICLDPGHGITNARAQERVSPLSQETKPAYVSGAEGSRQTEEEVNLAVAQLAKTELEALGAQVILTRTTHDATVSNQERAKIANNAGANLCIRIHADGSDDPSVRGMSMQVPTGDLLGTPEIESSSSQAAEIILTAVTEATGARNRGLTPRSDLTGFNWSEVPCILLEMGFLSNEEDDAALASPAYRQTIAKGIAAGVCHWVNLER